MIKLIFPLLVLILVLFLFYKGKLDSDITGFLILMLSVILLLGNNTGLLYLLSDFLSIQYVPLSIIATAISFLFSLCICLAVLIHDTRQRQIELLRLIAELKLSGACSDQKNQ